MRLEAHRRPVRHQIARLHSSPRRSPAGLKETLEPAVTTVREQSPPPVRRLGPRRTRPRFAFCKTHIVAEPVKRPSPFTRGRQPGDMHQSRSKVDTECDRSAIQGSSRREYFPSEVMALPRLLVSLRVAGHEALVKPVQPGMEVSLGPVTMMMLVQEEFPPVAHVSSGCRQHKSARTITYKHATRANKPLPPHHEDWFAVHTTAARTGHSSTLAQACRPRQNMSQALQPCALRRVALD